MIIYIYEERERAAEQRCDNRSISLFDNTKSKQLVGYVGKNIPDCRL